jgi:4-amino-4-deoxy-L-arabinose transferase-like glycosyltransferase
MRLLFLVALGVRLLAGAWLGHLSSPVAWEPEIIANNLLAGRGFLLDDHLGTSYRAFILPAYPFLCAFVYSFTRHSQFALVVLQCLLSAASCLQVRAIGELVFPKSRVGAGAAWLTAFHPGLIFFAIQLHPLTLDLFSYLWALWACLALFQKPTAGRALHLGIAAGLALLSRGTILFFLLFAAALFLWKAGRERWLGKAARLAALAMAIAALAVLPWLIRNAMLFKRFPLFITSASQSFWGGNNPLSIGTLHSRDGRPLITQLPVELETALAQADELRQSDLFRKEAWAFIRQNPWAAARLYLRKWVNFWWFSPTTGLYYPPIYAAAYGLFYAAAAALAIAGLWSVRHQLSSPPLLLLLLFPLFIAFFQCFYYVEGRHRWTVEPLLLLLAMRGARCASS